MNVHEYQAKDLMRQFNIAVLKGGVAETPAQAVEVAKKLDGKVWVVKAQIHAGGRGKGGGVKLAKSLEEVEKYAKEILGMQLITHQTGPEGKKVLKVLVEQGCDIEHEYYCGIVLDRAKGKLAFMVSTEGGMEIEKVAHDSPEKIVKAHIDPALGFTPAIGRKLGYALGLKGETLNKAIKFFEGLYNLYVQKDCSIAEINPLVTTKQGDVLALDGKLNFDDNALFRHPDIEALRDVTEESAQELEAGKFGLSYISLDGNIGCLVNGAGLAMATLDLSLIHISEPTRRTPISYAVFCLKKKK